MADKDDSTAPAPTPGEGWQQDLDQLELMLGDGFDWDEYEKADGTDTAEDLFRRLFIWHDYEASPRRPVGTVPCGGHDFASSTAAQVLYRTMYLLKPGAVDFSDMYKTGTLVHMLSPCSRFVCSFELFKYEPCIYFGCVKEFRGGEGTGVLAGWASADNGVHCTSDLGNRWFAAAVKALETKWLVYGGNDFKV